MTTAMSFSMTFMTPQFLSAVNGLTPSNIGFVLVPAAIASAIMGRKGGRVADTRGNFVLVFIASVFIFLAFSLLSTFIGVSAFVIALILIFGNVGQTFMQISMSNTISQTLSKEETGVGMGLLSMINFISGAMAMSVVGKLLDKGSTSLKLNPFVANEAANMYSNIFGVMSLLILLVVVLYRFQFGMGVSTLNMTSKGSKTYKRKYKEGLCMNTQTAPVSSQSKEFDNVKRLPILISMIIGAFFTILNETLLNVAFPQLMVELNVTASTLQWLSTGYMLVVAVLIPASALLVQWFTTRQVFIGAMVIFTFGTLVSAIAPGFSILLMGRLLQAAGTGLIMPVLMNTILLLYPPEREERQWGVLGL